MMPTRDAMQSDDVQEHDRPFPTDAVPASAPGGRGAEVQHAVAERTTPAERFDPRLLRLVALTLPEYDAVEMLALLCRLAQAKQHPLPGDEEPAVAVVACHGMSDLVTRPGWHWSREMSLAVLQALEALTVLVRVRRAQQTEIHLPLETFSLSHAAICTRVERFRQRYTNPKSRRVFGRLSIHLQHAEVKHLLDAQETQSSGQPSVSLARERSAEKRPYGMSTALVLARVQAALAAEAIPAASGERIIGRLTEELASEDGPQAPAPVLPLSSEREQVTGTITAQGHEACSRREPQPAPIRDQKPQDLPLQTGMTRPVAPALVPLSPEEDHALNAEALAVWEQVSTLEQQRSPDGVRRVQEIRTWLEEDPALVRAAVVNTLLQRIFPDRRGPLHDAAGWFASTYQRYRAGSLSISATVASWATSPYSSVQIEAALKAERKRQERSLLPPSRPDVSCLEIRDEQEPDPMMEPSLEPCPFFSPIWKRQAQALAEGGRKGPAPKNTRWDRRGHDEPEGLQAEQDEGQPEGDPFARMREQGSEVIPAASGISVGTPPPDQPDEPLLPSTQEQALPDVVTVEDPQTGWSSDTSALWWFDKLLETPLAQSSAIELLPTQYGRWVIWVTPHEEPERAWMWATGAEVRPYLEGQRAAKRQRLAPTRPSHSPRTVFHTRSTQKERMNIFTKEG